MLTKLILLVSTDTKPITFYSVEINGSLQLCYSGFLSYMYQFNMYHSLLNAGGTALENKIIQDRAHS